MQRTPSLLFISVLSLVLLSALPGCTILKRESEILACDPEDPCPPPSPCAKEDPSCIPCVEDQLVLSAKSIEKSLITLAAAEVAESPPILNTAPLVTPEGGMGGLVDIDWTGPVAPLVNKIACLTNYRVKILGNEPAIPIIVTITSKREVVANVLQNASLQAGKRAHILVFPCSRTIEVRYLS